MTTRLGLVLGGLLVACQPPRVVAPPEERRVLVLPAGPEVSDILQELCDPTGKAEFFHDVCFARARAVEQDAGVVQILQEHRVVTVSETGRRSENRLHGMYPFDGRFWRCSPAMVEELAPLATERARRQAEALCE